MPSVERECATRVREARLLLIALLCGATSLEGFDTKLASSLLAQLGNEFGDGPEVLGNTLFALSLGTLAALAVIPLADRLGWRPLMISSRPDSVEPGGCNHAARAVFRAWTRARVPGDLSRDEVRSIMRTNAAGLVTKAAGKAPCPSIPMHR